MQALNEVSDLQENGLFSSNGKGTLGYIREEMAEVKHAQLFGGGHPPDSGQHSGEALADHHGTQSPVCADGPSMRIVTRFLQEVVD